MRQAYYLASRRFVTFLIESKGMRTFLQLYASTQPEADIEQLYGMTREAAIKAAFGLKQQEASRP